MIPMTRTQTNRNGVFTAVDANRGPNLPRRLAICLLLVAAICSPGLSLAQQPTTREYKVKVAYLYNFTRYIRWPDAAFPDADAPFVIAVLGDDPCGGTLDALQQRKKAAGRRIEVRRFDSIDDRETVHILFISRTAPISQIEDLLQGQTSNLPRLIVCEVPGIAAAGAPVNFFQDSDGTIGFELNVDAIGRRGLNVDAKLLSIARVVRDGAATP